MPALYAIPSLKYGSITDLFRLYQGSIKALLRLCAAAAAGRGSMHERLPPLCATCRMLPPRCAACYMPAPAAAAAAQSLR